MKNSPFCLLLIYLLCSITANAQLKHIDGVDNLHPHPRIMLHDEDLAQIHSNINNIEQWNKIHNVILSTSDNIIHMPVLERKQVGKRLLDVSREALRRIFHLSYSYRTTKDIKYKDRAEKEILAVCQFEDWNPSHFLDVAEMTLAVSIGYDWLYNDLSEQSRAIIKEAIIKKGLDPSLDIQYNNNWLQSSSNWNQVCHTGMLYGALAVAEDIPGLARTIIDRSIEYIKLPMQKYGPDGTYPEGVVYWSYGTSFNVMFLSAIEKAFNSDFNLSTIQGFIPSSYYFTNMIAPSLTYFNYGDAGDPTGLSPTVFWFANKTKDMSLLWAQQDFMKKIDVTDVNNNRLFPAIMVWGKDVELDKVIAPSNRLWFGQGVTPVASMRSSWTNPNAIYVGFKAGRAGSGHSHMDIGSFIMEADGVRWALDLGIQDYNSLESVGIDLWNRKQNSQRWDVFRYNNFAHNTLSFNNQKQNVDGFSKIDKHGDNAKFTYVVSDITEAYKGQIKSSTRGIALVDNAYVVVQDEVETGEKATVMRWAMLTAANVKIKSNSTLVLKQKGKSMTLKVESADKIKLKTWSAQSSNAYDAANVGVTIVGFEVQIPPNTQRSYTVKLIPQEAKSANIKTLPLSKWE